LKAQILVVAGTKSRADILSRRIRALPISVDVVAATNPSPEHLREYALLVCEPGIRPTLDVSLLISSLAPTAQVILRHPKLSPAIAARYLQDPRVNHLLQGPASDENLAIVVHKLASGAIFGLDWYLPPQANVEYRRINSYRGRCEAIEELEVRLKEARMRASLSRATVRVVEELLMNAMYQAPVDDEGNKVFADVDPRQRIRKKTPRPVSLRYALHNQRVFLCVRDRFGTFRRDDLARCLLRCTTSEVQIENKKLGAGLGLYLIASTVDHLVVNILPGMVSEFICVLGPKLEPNGLGLLSVCTQFRERDLATAAEPAVQV
jgi:hypothetical protein